MLVGIDMTNNHCDYLRRIVANSIKHRLIEHNGNFSCDFDGYLLWTLRKSIEHWYVSLQDADDMLCQYWTKHEHNANHVFDKFFLDNTVIKWQHVTEFIDYIDEDFVDDTSLLPE